MKHHKKEVRKKLNVLEGTAFILIFLVVGLIAAISINFGNYLRSPGEFFAFLGMVILMGLIGGIPVVAIFYFFYNARFGETDAYEIGWSDGVADSSEIKEGIRK